MQTAAAAVAARIDGRVSSPNFEATTPAAAPVSERLEAYKTQRVNGRVSSPSIEDTETAIAPTGPHRTAASRIGKSEIETLCAPVTSICPRCASTAAMQRAAAANGLSSV